MGVFFRYGRFPPDNRIVHHNASKAGKERAASGRGAAGVHFQA